MFSFNNDFQENKSYRKQEAKRVADHYYYIIMKLIVDNYHKNNN